MQTRTFTGKELEDSIRITALAEKYHCSREYVRKVLKGNSPRNTIISQKILKDALDMFEILERETKITI